MSAEPLTNAALEWIRLSYSSLNALEERRAEILVSVADDFVYECREHSLCGDGGHVCVEPLQPEESGS